MSKTCDGCALQRDVALLAEELAGVRAENYRLLNELNRMREAYAAHKAATLGPRYDVSVEGCATGRAIGPGMWPPGDAVGGLKRLAGIDMADIEARVQALLRGEYDEGNK